MDDETISAKEVALDVIEALEGSVAEMAYDVLDVVGDGERAALDAVRRFVGAVDRALPGSGTDDVPSRRVEVIDSALKMIERLLNVSNEVAHKITDSVQNALPDLGDSVLAAEMVATPPKKAPAKKAPAKKAPAKKAPAKKAPAKKAPAKKAPAKKAPAKKASS